LCHWEANVAKPIVVEYSGTSSQFAHRKLDRSMLYGVRQRVVLDPAGAPCDRAELTTDGDLLVRRGMTAQGYVDAAGYTVSIRDMVGLDADGQPVERVDSTLGVAQPLEGPVGPEAVLDVRVSSVYMLEPEEVEPGLLESLQEGAVYRFPFAYRAGFKCDQGFLLANDHGVFALVGQPTETSWSALNQVLVETFDDDDDSDLDFDLF
jgi:hypothetical protein